MLQDGNCIGFEWTENSFQLELLNEFHLFWLSIFLDFLNIDLRPFATFTAVRCLKEPLNWQFLQYELFRMAAFIGNFWTCTLCSCLNPGFLVTFWHWRNLLNQMDEKNTVGVKGHASYWKHFFNSIAVII